MWLSDRVPDTTIQLAGLTSFYADRNAALCGGNVIIAGDFNHAKLKTVLPKFHQHVDFATRGVNTLDLVYSNIPGAYHTEPRSHLGYSDHISVLLTPTSDVQHLTWL
ncbi:hypothetical protein QTP70_024707 [Hemibagrus guttatus]|uniref:Endonuclease/exonuclease/phosphatase domain-containing protein n=1 Tax=Hemibagrus guttatus TaxID=175788 RepID=A0AAE0VG67_9TELE|nr:hypothetical protein QTP70_024707 [Hemibagrus guttatus]